jgi:hypothetical protein
VFAGTFTMTGGIISNNNTAGEGAGLYVYSGATFTQTGSANILGEIYNANLSQ